MSAFTREYVEELRREGQRKGERIRALTTALAAKTAEVEALRAARAPVSRVADSHIPQPQVK